MMPCATSVGCGRNLGVGVIGPTELVDNRARGVAGDADLHRTGVRDVATSSANARSWRPTAEASSPSTASSRIAATLPSTVAVSWRPSVTSSGRPIDRRGPWAPRVAVHRGSSSGSGSSVRPRCRRWGREPVAVVEGQGHRPVIARGDQHRARRCRGSSTAVAKLIEHLSGRGRSVETRRLRDLLVGERWKPNLHRTLLQRDRRRRRSSVSTPPASSIVAAVPAVRPTGVPQVVCSVSTSSVSRAVVLVGTFRAVLVVGCGRCAGVVGIGGARHLVAVGPLPLSDGAPGEARSDQVAAAQARSREVLGRSVVPWTFVGVRFGRLRQRSVDRRNDQALAGVDQVRVVGWEQPVLVRVDQLAPVGRHLPLRRWRAVGVFEGRLGDRPEVLTVLDRPRLVVHRLVGLRQRACCFTPSTSSSAASHDGCGLLGRRYERCHPASTNASEPSSTRPPDVAALVERPDLRPGVRIAHGRLGEPRPRVALGATVTSRVPSGTSCADREAGRRRCRWGRRTRPRRGPRSWRVWARRHADRRQLGRQRHDGGRQPSAPARPGPGRDGYGRWRPRRAVSATIR